MSYRTTPSSAPAHRLAGGRRLAAACTLAVGAAALSPGASVAAPPTPPPPVPGWTAPKAPCPGTLVPQAPAPTTSATGARRQTATPAPTVTTPAANAPRWPAPKVEAGQHPVGGDRLGSNGLVLSLPAGVPAPPDLDATSWVLAEQESGRIVAAKAPHAHLYPASTLKTLTAITLLDELPPTRTVTAAESDQAADGTRVGMVAGNPYRIDQLWGALILLSANDAAYALARSGEGGVLGTVRRMNELADRLGARDTVAVDPSGLDQPGQRSSSYDLAIFGREAMRRKDFRDYAGQRTIMFPGAKTQDGTVVAPYPVENHNHFLLHYPGATGVKNGYTTGAHRTYISSATRGSKSYLLTFMCSDTVSWPQMSAMMDWAFAHGDKADPVGTLDVAQPNPSASPSPGIGSGTPSAGAATPSSWPTPRSAALNARGTPNLVEKWWGAGLLALALVALGAGMTRRWSRRR